MTFTYTHINKVIVITFHIYFFFLKKNIKANKKETKTKDSILLKKVFSSIIHIIKPKNQK